MRLPCCWGSDCGKQLGEGETIAKGVVVFYNKGDDTLAEGVRIEFAEHMLKPFVDAIIAKYSSSPERRRNPVG